ETAERNHDELSSVDRAPPPRRRPRRSRRRRPPGPSTRGPATRWTQAPCDGQLASPRMTAPFTIAQLTDLHVGAPWGDASESAVATALAAVALVLGRPADAVVVTGDIANTPTDAEYERARMLLDELAAPVYVLPGNHDDRDALRRHFPLPATEAEHLSYVADLGPIRMIALDTVRPAESGGQLDGPRLAWLKTALAANRTTPTLLAMHHPPLDIGQSGMDAIGIPEPQRRALGAILAHHPQVHRIISGHVHHAVI